MHCEDVKRISSRAFESTFQIPVDYRDTEIFSDNLTGRLAAQFCVQDGFTYVTGGEPNPGDDLRPYNISSPEMFKFILQVPKAAQF